MIYKIEVVGAVIKNAGTVLLAQRARGELKGKWEFPGGKVEVGESHQEALMREIYEELGVQIAVNSYISSVAFKVGEKSLVLHCYWSQLISGTVHLNEHNQFKWVELGRLLDYDLAPADIPIAKKVINSDW